MGEMCRQDDDRTTEFMHWNKSFQTFLNPLRQQTPIKAAPPNFRAGNPLRPRRRKVVIAGTALRRFDRLQNRLPVFKIGCSVSKWADQHTERVAVHISV